jgi:predicted ester cyclase
MEGTFTKPWPMGGKVIPPTGNKLKLTAVTLARWQNGCIAEEQLFWDNAAYMQQLGIK